MAKMEHSEKDNQRMMKKLRKKILHKFWADYTKKEIIDIKNTVCMDCPHLIRSTVQKLNSNKLTEDSIVKTGVYGSDGKRHYNDNASCEFIGHTGFPRYCRPEICPYNTSKGGVKLNQVTHEKLVSFDFYCKDCKHYDKKESEDPCHECLANPTNYESHKPVKFEKRTGNDTTRRA